MFILFPLPGMFSLSGSRRRMPAYLSKPSLDITPLFLGPCSPLEIDPLLSAEPLTAFCTHVCKVHPIAYCHSIFMCLTPPLDGLLLKELFKDLSAHSRPSWESVLHKLWIYELWNGRTEASSKNHPLQPLRVIETWDPTRYYSPTRGEHLAAFRSIPGRLHGGSGA